jgi:hypothetical protein
MATGFYRTFNTNVSGTVLTSALSGNDVKLLEFAAALKQKPPITLTNAADNTLDVEEWMQSAIGSLSLRAPTGPCYIKLGDDTAEQAANYISLFDLKTTSDERLLRFVLADVGGSGCSVILANSSTGPQSNTYVEVSVQDIGSAAAEKKLFDAATGISFPLAGNVAGLERLVLVKATDVTVGAEAVEFNILPYSL